MADPKKVGAGIGGVVVAVLVALLSLWLGDGGGDDTAADPSASASAGDSASATAGADPTSGAPGDGVPSGYGDRGYEPGEKESDPGFGQGPDDPSTEHSTEVDPESGLAWVSVDELPAEARETLDLIVAGGPFPYPGKDGSTFGNFEGILPDQPRGYYAEYTVPTPGEDDRGARRIVTGDGGEYYWTADHYESFERIDR